MKATFTDENWLRHHRYSHLSLKNLNLVSEKDYVDDLSMIKDVDEVCENYVVGKHHHDSFPKGLARRASKPA